MYLNLLVNVLKLTSLMIKIVHHDKKKTHVLKCIYFFYLLVSRQDGYISFRCKLQKQFKKPKKRIFCFVYRKKN